MQPRDLYQSVESFLDDHSFRAWILEGEDPHAWEEWTLEDPQRAKLVEEARAWLLAMRVEPEATPKEEIQEAFLRTWHKIRALEESNTPEQRALFYRWPVVNVAASLLLIGVLLGGIYTIYTRDFSQLDHSDLEGHLNIIEKNNRSGQAMLLVLPDSSSVLLQPKSTLGYPATFAGNERRVYLAGDAFFEVSKNARKPFYVHASGLVTRVVGTSFRVKAFPDQKEVEVVVRTGKVHVAAEKSGNEEILLLPNQGIRFTRQRNTFEKIEDLTREKALSAELSTIERLSFEFADVPVSQIFRTIEQAYLVKIDFPANRLDDCYLTTSLSDQPLSEKLKIICESLGGHTSYQIHENRVTIQSNGCD